MDIDPVGLLPASGRAALKATTRPVELVGATARWLANVWQIPTAAACVAVGSPQSGPMAINPSDRRFADPAWTQNAAFFALRQWYLAACAYGDDVIEAGRIGSELDSKVRLLADYMQGALSPTNMLLLNPDAMIQALRTGGRSVATGTAYAIDDLVHRDGKPLKVDRSDFTVGETLAATPGKVVFRNALIELIQYAPQTETVHAVPLLLSPPWINKYYVMDLAPGRSLVEWAVQQGRTVFCISYLNPDEAMRDLTMDDYASLGVLAAAEVVREITDSEKVDLVGLCLGGAMAAMAASYLADETPFNTVTLLNTLLDYTDPGALGPFIDPATLSRLEARMDRRGYLPGEDMAQTFDHLRPNDLIFNYVASRWLKGEPPPAFDILAWNEDSTRMPATMHSTYLRSLYERNDLATGNLSLLGRRLDLSRVTSDIYVVGAINDHIVPWTASYAGSRLLGGNVRYVLSSGGHIAGVVNPPSPKGWWSTVEDGSLPADPEQWRAQADKQSGSWWTDWTAWAAPRAGEQRTPPRMGSAKHPPLCDAPGTYIHG